MQLAPRYGDRPIIDLEEEPGAVLGALARQRRRFVEELQALDDEQLATAPTRCDGWAPRDVISHLDTADGFWAWSARAGLAGEPTQLLAGFDPVASPAQMAAADARTGAEVVAAWSATVEQLIATLEGADAEGWRALAEGPPGHLTLTALAHHALWDGWIHERDVLLPLGHAVPLDADEVRGALRYAAALAPGYGLISGATDQRGVLEVVPTGASTPGVGEGDAFHVEVGDEVLVRSGRAATADLTLEGDAVQLIDALSTRAQAPDVPEEHAWMISSLRVVFDQG